MKDKVPGWMRELIKTLKEHGEDPYDEELRALRLAQLLEGIRNS